MNVEENKKVVFEKDDYLWRYIDIHKLFSFILDKKLFFTRLDNFDDPLEGLTEDIIGNMSIVENIPDDLNPSLPEESKISILAEKKEKQNYVNEQTERYQKKQFANCWFVGKKESFAMWNLYSNTNSVAIRYNPKELLDIVIPSAESYIHEDFKVFIYGFVDYDNIWPFDFFKQSDKKIRYSAFKKDLCYIHEREFRFVTIIPYLCIGKYDDFELPLGDISKDNFKIFANPYMKTWKLNNLKRILEKFSLQDKLIQSALKVK
jgi:hypothetical protein